MVVLEKTSSGGTKFTNTVLLPSEINIQQAIITIPTASVLTLNSIPYQIAAAPGAGYAIQVISANARIKTYGGVAYATNVTITLISDTAISASNYQALNNTILQRTSSCIKGFTLVATGGGAGDDNSVFIENKALMAYVLTGNPTAGNSDIIINVLYRIITL